VSGKWSRPEARRADLTHLAEATPPMKKRKDESQTLKPDEHVIKEGDLVDVRLVIDTVDKEKKWYVKAFFVPPSLTCSPQLQTSRDVCRPRAGKELTRHLDKLKRMGRARERMCACARVREKGEVMEEESWPVGHAFAQTASALSRGFV
jgi:hypothetical protein